MVKINEYERTANFAWSHDGLPLLASASAAGAVDLDFSSASKLEIFDVFDRTAGHGVVETALESKVYGLDWSRPTASQTRGVVAGALENGTVQLWDACGLLDGRGADAATLHRGVRHSGHVKTVQFSPTQDHVLASAGSKGEIFIWDTNKFDDPAAPGKAMTPMEDVTCISWNHNVRHVFASAGSTGYTSIWDLRAKKEVLHLTYTGTTGRCNLSVVAWNPAESTQLVTASDSDHAPHILAWNLRNPKEPETVMAGHKKGVLSLDWCRQDPELLLSCGKDNATFLWDPVHGVQLGEYPTTANWVFETRFAPALPDVFASASFDGKVVVQSLQDTTPPADGAAGAATATATANADDFWGQLASTDTQQPHFAVQKAPNWLKRPTSVSFGFGGKLVHVTQPVAAEHASVVTIGTVVPDAKVAADVRALRESIAAGDFEKIVRDRLDVSHAAARADWALLDKLLTTDRLDLLKGDVAAAASDAAADAAADAAVDATVDADAAAAPADDTFFDKLGSESDLLFEPPSEPFHVFGAQDSDSDTKLKQLVLSGKSAAAVDLCIEQDRLTEALVLALDADDTVKSKVKNAYFTKAIPDSSVARVLYSATAGDVSDLVNNGDVSNWRQIASSIAVFHRDAADFSTKISELGDRVLADSSSATARDDALLCYAAGGALDKISGIWLDEIAASEKSNASDSSTTAAEAHFRALADFVEKITVYRAASNISSEFSGPGIDQLCSTVAEYAGIVANLGEFDLALQLLALVPGSSEQLKIEKDRVLKAASKTASVAPVQPSTKKTASYSRPTPYGAATGAAAPAAAPAVPLPAASPAHTNGYTPLAAPSANPYAVSGAANPYAAVAASAAAAPGPHARNTSTNPYAPVTALDTIQHSAGSGIGSPLHGAASVVPPPPPPKIGAKAKDAGGWNDLPVHLGVRNSKSGTSTPSPYANVAASAAASYAAKPEPPSRLASYSSLQSSVPPPPRAAAPPSAAAAAAASAAPSVQASPKTPQGPSKSSRYAPPPMPQTAAAGIPPQAPVANGFGGVTSPPIPAANPYAPKPAPNPYAPPPPGSNGYSVAPPVAGSYSAPPPPAAGSSFAPPPPPPAAPAPVSAAPAPQVPAKQRHPVGDRSHIPASQAPIFETLGSTLQQTASKMPEKYAKQVKDTEKRLNILFELLNNEELGQEIVSKLLQVSESLQSGDLTTAATLQGQVALDHPTECGQWMVGLKRLIQMTEAANR